MASRRTRRPPIPELRLAGLSVNYKYGAANSRKAHHVTYLVQGPRAIRGPWFIRRRMMPHQELREGLTFDDVLLLPQYSELLPSQCHVGTRLTPRIQLRIPLLASPMDTVTESRT